MKTINYLLCSLAIAASSLAQTNIGLNGANGGSQNVPDSSSSALLLGMGLVASLLIGRRFIKK
jgi:hypothetical protein